MKEISLTRTNDLIGDFGILGDPSCRFGSPYFRAEVGTHVQGDRVICIVVVCRIPLGCLRSTNLGAVAMDNYRIEGKIGEGAHGVVLKAKEIRSGATVSLERENANQTIPNRLPVNCELICTGLAVHCVPTPCNSGDYLCFICFGPPSLAIGL